MMEPVRPSPFSDESIRAAVDKALGQAKPGERVAFVAVAERVGEDIQTRLAVSVNFGYGWSFSGFLSGDVKRPLQDVGAELRWSF